LERTGGNDLVTAGRHGSLLASAPPRAAPPPDLDAQGDLRGEL